MALARPALPAAAFGAIAEDELAVRRAGELEAACLRRKSSQGKADRKPPQA